MYRFGNSYDRKIENMTEIDEVILIRKKVFKREADIMEALDGLPHVVKFMARNDKDQCIFMEKYSCDMHDFMKYNQGWWDDNSPVDAMMQMVDGVMGIHRRGYVHMDIKPENIFMMSPREVYIGDFGLSRKIGDTVRIKDGNVYGTVGYIAPELHDANRFVVDPAMDVYSLGVTFAYMLYPLEAEDAADTMYNDKECDVDAPMHALQQMLCEDPTERITLVKLREALQDYKSDSLITRKMVRFTL